MLALLLACLAYFFDQVLAAKTCLKRWSYTNAPGASRWLELADPFPLS